MTARRQPSPIAVQTVGKPEALSLLARLVLVDGLAPGVAALQAGVSPQSVSNATGRVKRAHAAILEAYGS